MVPIFCVDTVAQGFAKSAKLLSFLSSVLVSGCYLKINLVGIGLALSL
jgi:hypothetical protein